jgi:subtilisin family serine protease
LNNTGAPQEVELTDILVRTLRSVPGEDAGVLHAPAEDKAANKKILVAVIDTGVDLTHPALQSALHKTQSECAAAEAYQACIRTSVDKEPCHQKFANMDTDGNGYPLDCQGWNVLDSKNERAGLRGGPEVVDEIGHGTHVAGIIGANAPIPSVAPVSGIASQIEILPVQVDGKAKNSFLSSSTAAPPSSDLPSPSQPEFVDDGTQGDTVARGILYALRSGAKVMNLSFGFPLQDDSQLLRETVALAQTQGVLFVAAAGNQSSGQPVYPCQYAGVICVASFSSDGSISHFSDYGDAVDVAAPGHKILSSYPFKLRPKFFTERSGYDFMSGTSMAAPFVTGALARLLNAGFTPAEAYARMLLGTRPSLTPSVMPELHPKFTLSGNLDLAKAFQVTPQPLVLPAIKDPVLLPLEKSASRASFRLQLRNAWAAPNAAGIQVHVELPADGVAARAGLKLSQGAAAEFKQWPMGETRVIEGVIEWPTVSDLSRLPGAFQLEVSVKTSVSQRTFLKSAEFVVPVRPMPPTATVSADLSPSVVGQFRRGQFRRVVTDIASGPSKMPPHYAFKAFTCLPVTGQAVAPAGTVDSKTNLMLIGNTAKITTLQLLEQVEEATGPALRRRGGAAIDTTRDSLLAVSCLDRDQDGKRDYAVAALNKNDKKIVVTLYDGFFRRQPQKLEYSTELAVMPEEFRWLSKGTGPLEPAWIARGRLPEAERPGFDPWETHPDTVADAQDYRLYLLGDKGLHTIPPPKDYRLAGLLKGSFADLRDGAASVLLYTGESYISEFYVARLEKGKWSRPERLTLPEYHRLGGTRSVGVFSDVSQSPGSLGSAFAEESAGGRFRLSYQVPAGSRDPLKLRELLLEPSRAGDVATQILSVFSVDPAHAELLSAFFRSRFLFYFFDARDGRTSAAEPGAYDGATRHVGGMLSDGTPALVLAEGQGSGLTADVLVPRAGEAELWRPASLKTLGVSGPGENAASCEPVQLNETGSGGSGSGATPLVTRLIYFCGDHFVFVGL